MNVYNKKTVIDTLAIFCVKKISNLFWEIADTWSYKNNKIAQRYDNSIEEEYQKECKSYGLPSNSKVLHIGCGAYPLTDIVLAQCYSGALVGIDKNPLAVKEQAKQSQGEHCAAKHCIEHGDPT